MKLNNYLFGILIFSFLMHMPVYGQGGIQNSVIDSQREGSIVIHKIAAENLEEYTTPATGLNQDITGLKTIENITFTVIRASEDTTSAADAQAMVGEGEYSVSIATNSEGVAEFKNLAQGIYLVKEESSPSVSKPVDDFLVSIPMTDPERTGWIYDVHVYPKNQLISLPEFGMSVGGSGRQYVSVNAGEETGWTITSEIPRDIGTSVLFKVQCRINEFFNFHSGSAEVYTEDKNGQRVDLKAEEYIFTQEEQGFSIEINGSGKETLSKLAVQTDETYTPVLYMDYITDINYGAGNFEEALGKPLYNEVKFFYTSALNIEHNGELSEENRPYIYTGGFSITKFDGKTDQNLSNAVFRLYTSANDAKAGTNPVLEPGKETPWEISTNDAGKAYFYGLSYGEENQPVTADGTTYYLVEMEAPEGYNLLGSPVSVNVNAVSHLEENTVLIKNNAGFVLPVTGGAGTAIFTAAGLTIVGLSAYILFRVILKKRV